MASHCRPKIFHVFVLFAGLCTVRCNISHPVQPLDAALPALRESNAGGSLSGVDDEPNPTVSPVFSDQALRQTYYEPFGTFGSSSRRRCPLCDSSVFPYCGEKLFHDACCCTDPYQYPLPYKCQLADCAFLHANTCREHRLIANCCCSDEYRSFVRGRDAAVAEKAVDN
ncbi:uncharacterized protein LOC124183037 [Neodiprion fabricii]|uniref:uncharacterized protein LOC124183037 n=1 Tax=Neodiprion fabricii TaxID=2872261 RepID=UPI001ED8ED09|nr:uncharacterized protein LOC124183037 [Neodiprion fabricii]